MTLDHHYHPPTTHHHHRKLNVGNISAVTDPILMKLGSFLGTSQTDSNYQVDICPGDICHGDICPYQEYLHCLWPNYDETWKVASREHIEQIPTLKLTFVQSTFILATK